MMILDMETNKSYFKNHLVLLISALYLSFFTSCEPDHELPLVIPQVDNSMQYIDMYCGQNSTSSVISFGVQAIIHNNMSVQTDHGRVLKNGRMDCFLFRIHDEDSYYDGILDLSMQHRIPWLDFCNKMDGVHITTYESKPDDFSEDGWHITNKRFFIDQSKQKDYLATDQDHEGMFYSSNYASVSLESIQGKLNPDDQELLDKYLTQVEEGHVRVFVYSVTDEYVATLETLPQ